MIRLKGEEGDKEMMMIWMTDEKSMVDLKDFRRRSNGGEGESPNPVRRKGEFLVGMVG